MTNTNTATELGTKDGTRFAKRINAGPAHVRGLALAHVVGEKHWAHMEAGRLEPEDAVDYGTAFLQAYTAETDKRHANPSSL